MGKLMVFGTWLPVWNTGVRTGESAYHWTMRRNYFLAYRNPISHPIIKSTLELHCCYVVAGKVFATFANWPDLAAKTRVTS